MTDSLKKFELGQEAIDYLGESLKSGKALSQMILNKIDFTQGVIFTYLSETTPNISVKDFKTGGKIKLSKKLETEIVKFNGFKITPTPNMNFAILEEIKKYLESNDQNICLIEDPISGVNDSWLNSYKPNYVLGRNTVFHLINLKDFDKNNAKYVLNKSSSISPPNVIILSTTNRKELVSKEITEISEDELENLVNNLSTILVNSYDGESYLIWQKKKTN